MEAIEKMVLDFFTTHPDLVPWLSLVVAAHGLALAIVAMTPTPKDDNWVRRIYSVVEWVAGVVGKTKDKGDNK